MEITLQDLIKLWGPLNNIEKLELSSNLGNISTDTRTLKKGDFFVPLVGEKFDGHNFLEKAFDIGIQAAVISEKYNGAVPIDLPHWVVLDTLHAYQQIALLHRRNLQLPVIAITGSVGKTTTRELIRAILSPFGDIVSSHENENNDIGVPKTLLRGKSGDAAIVLEMGMRGLGQIERLSRIAEPDIAVITNIGYAHLGLLGSRENIARAKSEITSNLKPDGVVVIPYGDNLLEKVIKEKWSGRIIRVAIKDYLLDRLEDEKRNFFLKDIEPDFISKIDTNLNSITFQEKQIKLPLEGRHNAMNFLMALSVANEFGISVDNLLQLKIDMPHGRNTQENCGKYLVLDETYNSSPDSVVASLELLVSKPGRHFAVLGTMLELGEESDVLHRKVVEKAVQMGLEGIVFVTCSQEEIFVKEIIQHLPNYSIVKTPEEAAIELLRWLSPGDVVLIKGSRALELEKVLPYLRQ